MSAAGPVSRVALGLRSSALGLANRLRMDAGLPPLSAREAAGMTTAELRRAAIDALALSRRERTLFDGTRGGGRCT